MSISTDIYSRLLTLADQAPVEGLRLTERALARAKTLGYYRIGQIRNAPENRLLADLGADLAEEMSRALQEAGMRQP